ncbi:MAG TPA: hypothetical protein VMS98_16765 [Thermoanaerobaculia bacterium]|nr:hypothetical protein [Thermoanaerobaculia bacterium]
MHKSDEETIRALEDLPPEEPPADLRQNVMNAITSGAPRLSRGNGGRLVRRSTFVYGWAAAAAVVILVLFFAKPVEDGDFAATMASVITRYPSEKATLVVRRRGDFLTVTPIVQEAGSVSIRWDPAAAALVVISGASDASSRQDGTTFTVREPAQRVAVTLRMLDPATPLTEVWLSVGDEEVLRAKVPLE